MSVLIFVIILAILILVHEFGHFIVAIKSGIKVSEFGIGFPPRIARLFRWRETDFTLNAIPAGGFVKIFGENPDEESLDGPESGRSFARKPRWIQALVLIAGVSFNVIFAWLIIALGFMIGLPTPAGYAGAGGVQNARVVIVSVAQDSPASHAGLSAGDAIVSVRSEKGEAVPSVTPDTVSEFIQAHGDASIVLQVARGAETIESAVVPSTGIIEGKKAIGISMDTIGTLRLPMHLALWEAGKTVVTLIGTVTVGLVTFLFHAVVGQGDFSQVTGPVGIVSMVGDATRLGFVHLISFTAFISINLAVINMIPFPALDGGRLLFVAIEAVRRKPISPKVSNAFNGIGFVLLLVLMVVVTFHDIVKLF